ncbi:TPA: YqgE/AlgH family protein [Mannheimia haemolytica]|nr:YqgE/AlgH family protein [Mannheimia haemolytica]
MLENLQGKFLIATPEMDDDYFERTVVYICEHNPQGAMGVVINTPTDLSVLELITRMDFQMANQRDYKKDKMVLSGGPVNQDRGFIIHTKTANDFIHTYPITDKITLTTSGDVLDSFGTLASPEKFIVCLGCSTWRGSQLEQEIAQNYWIVSDANEKTLFETGYLERWAEAYEMMGLSSIPSRAGRA